MYRFLFLAFLNLLLSSCQGDDNALDYKEESIPLNFTSYKFEKAKNANLNEDVVLTIGNSDTLLAYIPELEYADSLIPTFSVDWRQFEKVTVGGAEQKSGVTHQDYSRIVQYDLECLDKRKKTVYIKVLVANAIPRIDVETEGAVGITSKKDYVKAIIRISNCPEVGTMVSEGKIRGRGNASWSHPKKSYKIKFSKKQSPFGFPDNKDWVLLGNYTDRSLLRTAYMSEVSKALNMKFTVNYQHVDLYLNGDYRGTYMLTDHVEKAKNRVNVNADGFFIEADNYYQYEPLWFITELYHKTMTFKYPDPDDGEKVKDDDNYLFIQDFMNKVEKTVTEIPNGSREYLNYIEPHSFAKYIIAEEVLANFDSNIYYVLQSRDAKLEMYPLWDFEWSLGMGEVDENGWIAPPYQPRTDKSFWNNIPYVRFMLQDPDFVSILKEEWRFFKENVPAIKEKIKSVRHSLNYTQEDNFKKWPILDKFVSKEVIALGDWNLEVDYINNFFDKRVEWCDNFFLNEL